MCVASLQDSFHLRDPSPLFFEPHLLQVPSTHQWLLVDLATMKQIPFDQGWFTKSKAATPIYDPEVKEAAANLRLGRVDTASRNRGVLSEQGNSILLSS